MEHRGASSADNISGDGAGIDGHIIKNFIDVPVFIHHLFICTYRYIQEYMCIGIRDTKLSHKDSLQCFSKGIISELIDTIYFENLYLNVQTYY
jgi:hypothetical protein